MSELCVYLFKNKCLKKADNLFCNNLNTSFSCKMWRNILESNRAVVSIRYICQQQNRNSGPSVGKIKLYFPFWYVRGCAFIFFIITCWCTWDSPLSWRKKILQLYCSRNLVCIRSKEFSTCTCSWGKVPSIIWWEEDKNNEIWYSIILQEKICKLIYRDYLTLIEGR